MRYTGPKNRVSRREGIDLGLKTPGSKSHARLLKKMGVLPGQHGTRGKRKSSGHAKQLREKQKLRYTYGISESQLHNYFYKASSKKGNTAFYLTQFLESRLDNIVYRAGFAPTRAAARQLVAHKNIKVNDQVMSIASYPVQMNDTITFANEKLTKVAHIEKSLSNQDTIIPSWMERRGLTTKVVAQPINDDLNKNINLRLVVEFYSR